MTKYFVDGAGKYLGAFDGANPPAGAVQVPNAPGHGADLWLGNGNWDTSQRPVIKNPQRAALMGILARLKNLDSANSGQYDNLLQDIQNGPT